VIEADGPGNDSAQRGGGEQGGGGPSAGRGGLNAGRVAGPRLAALGHGDLKALDRAGVEQGAGRYRGAQGEAAAVVDAAVVVELGQDVRRVPRCYVGDGLGEPGAG